MTGMQYAPPCQPINVTAGHIPFLQVDDLPETPPKGKPGLLVKPCKPVRLSPEALTLIPWEEITNDPQEANRELSRSLNQTAPSVGYSNGLGRTPKITNGPHRKLAGSLISDEKHYNVSVAIKTPHLWRLNAPPASVAIKQGAASVAIKWVKDAKGDAQYIQNAYDLLAEFPSLVPRVAADLEAMLYSVSDAYDILQERDAVLNTYLRTYSGEYVARVDSKRGYMTNFPLTAWGLDLRKFGVRGDASKREATRRILIALELNRAKGHSDKHGFIRMSARALSEYTGIGTTALRKHLARLESEGQLKANDKKNCYRLFTDVTVPPVQAFTEAEYHRRQGIRLTNAIARAEKAHGEFSYNLARPKSLEHHAQLEELCREVVRAKLRAEGMIQQGNRKPELPTPVAIPLEPQIRIPVRIYYLKNAKPIDITRLMIDGGCYDGVPGKGLDGIGRTNLGPYLRRNIDNTEGLEKWTSDYPDPIAPSWYERWGQAA